MTRLQIKDRIVERLDRSDTTVTALVENFINESMKSIEQIRPFAYTKKSQTAPLVADTKTYTLPTGLILHHPWEFLLQSITSPTTYAPVLKVGDRTFDLDFPSPTDPTGTSAYYILRGGTDALEFDVYPVPSENRTLELRGGYFYSTAFTIGSGGDASTNWLTDNYPDILIESSSAKAHSHYGESQKAADAYAFYKEYLNGDPTRGIAGLIGNEIRMTFKGRQLRIKTPDDQPLTTRIRRRLVAYG